MKPPRYPLEGVVSWNMNTTCNYRCAYCTQRFADSRKRWARDLPRFIEAFCALPGDWEIKLSGGEPFQHPGFLDAVEALTAGGLRVSAVTNLSAAPARLAAFADATAARPGLLSASLHLQYAEPGAFFDKLAAFRDRYRGRVVTTCVATRAHLPRLPALRAAAADRGLSLKIQPEKQDRDVIAYTPGGGAGGARSAATTAPATSPRTSAAAPAGPALATSSSTTPARPGAATPPAATAGSGWATC